METTEDTAMNIHAFIAIFFQTFTHLSGRLIYLSRESYAVTNRQAELHKMNPQMSVFDYIARKYLAVRIMYKSCVCSTIRRKK